MKGTTAELLRRNLKKFRKKAGLTQSEVAEALGVSNQTVARWELGTRIPSIEHLEKLAELYGITVADFFKPIEDDYELLVATIASGLLKLSEDEKVKFYSILENLVDLVLSLKGTKGSTV